MDQNPRWPTATAHQKEALFTVSTKNVREMKRAAKVLALGLRGNGK